MVGIICPPMVEIRLTDLPKSGGATPRDDGPALIQQGNKLILFIKLTKFQTLKVGASVGM